MTKPPKSRNFFCLFTLLVFALSGCTLVRVEPVSRSLDLKEVCIQENPLVKVPQFLTVMREGFDRHGILTEVRSESNVDRGKCIVTYTASKSWDLGTYLSHAEIRLDKGNHKVGYAEYHLRGKGGLSLLKWQGVRTKIAPVMDELLREYPITTKQSLKANTE